MFRKVEAYITPVLLSHVEKYVKDFKPEHTELSLWSGSVTLHNLELRTDVIQREFNLPFNLASGHIHELTIQVPWTKIISEPIVITVNTIECVLKLRESNSPEGAKPPVFQTSKNELDAPPGYTQSLVNRIVNNMSFHCHNLILKYVEEDIVMSVNIKHFYLESTNADWLAAFNEMTPEDLHLRKIMRLNDLTLCLDKRNAAGKIETYLEPLLYRCELEFRLDSLYKSMTSKRPLNTKISVHSPKLEFSISYQQIPMVMRLSALIYALKQKNVHIESSDNATVIFNSSVSDQDRLTSDDEKNQDTWGGWIWSFVPQFPLGYDNESQDSPAGNFSSILLISVNLEIVTFTFKIPEYINDTPGIYGGIKKIRYVPTCHLELSSIVAQSSSIGFERFCFRGGIRSIILYPSTCVCGIEEKKDDVILETSQITSETEFLSWPVEDNIMNTVDMMSADEMLAVAPAIAFSYLYKMTVPEDIQDKSVIPDMDMEYSNYKESAFMKIVAGQFTLNVCAGFFHRFSVLKSAIACYDYASYSKYKPLLKSNELLPPSTEDYDTLSEFVPNVNIQIMFKKPQIKFIPWNHPTKVPKHLSSSNSNTIFIKRKVSQQNQSWSYENLKVMPCLLLDAEMAEIFISKPMYPRRLTYVSCQLPEPAPLMLEGCYYNSTLKIQHLRCFIQSKNSFKGKKYSNTDRPKSTLTPVITDCTFCSTIKELNLPEYWIHNNLLSLYDFTFNIDNLSINGTMSKLLLAYHIVRLVHPELNDSSMDLPTMLTISLIKDATQNKDFSYLEMVIDGLSLRSNYLQDLVTHRIVINNLKLFAIQPTNPSIQPICIVSAPDDMAPPNSPFFKGVMQLSDNKIHPSFVTCKSEKVSIILNPLLFNWITYKYKHYNESSHKDNISASISTKSPSERPLSTSRSLEDVLNRSLKLSNRRSVGQSSSEREKDFVHGTSVGSQNINEVPDDAIQIEPEKQIITNMSLKDRIIATLFRWRYTAVYIELDGISIAFPTKTESLIKMCPLTSNYREGIFVIKLPTSIIKTAVLKQNLLCYCVHGLPVKLPETVWEKETLAYPLNVSLSGLSCYTLLSKEESTEINIHNESRFSILKDVVSNITVTFTPKVGSSNEGNMTSLFIKKRKVSDKGKSSNKKKEMYHSQVSDTILVQENQSKSDLNKVLVTETDMDKMIYSRAAGKLKHNSEIKLSSLGICVHIDTGPLIISFCNYQVAILTSILKSLVNVIVSINPTKEVQSVQQIVKLSQHKLSEHSHDLDFSTLDYSSTADSYCYKQSDNQEKQKSTLYSSFDELDSGIMRESFIEKSETQDDKTVENDNSLSLTGWFQWTVSNILVKIYASSQNNSYHNLKLVFCAEDIMASLDSQAEYFKLKSKIVTSSLYCFKRIGLQDLWKSNDFSGIIMSGRENESSGPSNDENCFVSVTITRARCASVHSKLSDLRTKAQKSNLLSDSYISEVEISLQPLDIILSLSSLKPFIVEFMPHLIEINSSLSNFNKMSTKRATSSFFTDPYQWDSRKYALCYLETSKIRIFVPLKVESYESKFNQDVFILQIDKISITSVADNPICRSPLRPDLYQKAARNCILNIPGSMLEDRQCQLSVKRISIQTAQWTHIEKRFFTKQSQEESFNENPALKWNNSHQDISIPSCDPPITIIQMLDICLVVALSMFQNQELVCSPCVDFSILTDIDISVCIQQIELFIKIMNKFSELSDCWSDSTKGFDEDTTKSPTENDENKSTSSRTQPLKHFQTLVPKKLPNVAYFDLCVTLGRMNINIYECVKENTLKSTLQIFPLLHTSFYQPNFMYSLHNYSQKIQLSLFSTNVNLSDRVLENEVSLSKDKYEMSFLETSLGMPNKTTGILPALFTASWESSIGNKTSGKINICCPVKFLVSKKILRRIHKLSNLCTELFTNRDEIDRNEEKRTATISKHYFQYFQNVNISTSQLVVSVAMETAAKNCELNLSIVDSQFAITSFSRPDKVSVVGTINSIISSIGELQKDHRQLFILPWNIRFIFKILTNQWRPGKFFSIDSQYIETIIKSDKLCINLTADSCEMIKKFSDYWNENRQKNDDPIKHVPSKDCFWDENTVYDQHYKDDLRAGAFKFIISPSGQPLPYQVFINPRGLIWKYPQPRAITRVHSFPVMFQNNTSSTNGVKCTLEYYCEVLDKFIVYSTFPLKQDKGVKLELEKFNQNIILASMWKVVLHFDHEMDILTEIENENPNYNYDSFPIRAHTLAACLRIDSYFSPHLVNKIKLALDVSCIEVSLYNNNESNPNFKLANLYTVDSVSPPPYVFFRLILNNINGMMRVWNYNTMLLKVSSQLSCEAVNGNNLSLYNILQIEDARIRSWIGGRKEDEAKIEITIGHLGICGGPHLTRALINSLHLWQLQLAQDKTDSKICLDCTKTKPELTVQKYVICNDTNVMVRFGQEGTDEYVMLQSRHSYFYSWRSSNRDPLLRLAVQEGDWQSCKGFCIDKIGISTIELICDDDSLPKLTMIISVEDFQSTQKMVTFMGRLIITNLLTTDFDFKLFQKKNNKGHTMASPVFPIAADMRSPSLFVDNDTETTFRLKFSGCDTGWTGDIPLKECVKSNIPWLVKVPSKINTQYISAWCRVILDNVHGRILVILSPLYIIKSHLAMNVSIALSSENFETEEKIVINGKGSLHPIICPGTTATKHEMIFISYNNHIRSAVNNVPFNFSLLNQATFFPDKKDLPDIDTILENIHQWKTGIQTDTPEWPYIVDAEDEEWLPMDSQISTEVSVRYTQATLGVDSMIVDLTPWALFANSAGLTIGIVDSEDNTVCRVDNKSVITPPSFLQMDKFFICIFHNDVKYVSEELYLSTELPGPYEKRPKGKIFMNENTTFTIAFGNSICRMCLSYEIKCNIAVFHLSSKYILCNKSSISLYVLPVFLPATSQSKLNILNGYKQLLFELQPTSKNSFGIPILQFYSENTYKDEDYIFFIVFGSDNQHSSFSCPIQINHYIPRKNIALKKGLDSIPLVVTFHEVKGQIIMSVHDDAYPQLQIRNDSKVSIFAGQIVPKSSLHETDGFLTNQDPYSRKVSEECLNCDWHCLVEPDCSVYYTMPLENLKYPEMSPNTSAVTTNSYLSLAYGHQNSDKGLLWSSPINVMINTTEQFIKLPGYVGDIKVTVDCSFHLTNVTIQNVTEIDISASEIRHRLMGNVEPLPMLVFDETESTSLLSSEATPEKYLKTGISKTFKETEMENRVEHFLKRFRICAIVNELEIRLTLDDNNSENSSIGEIFYTMCNNCVLSTTLKEKGIGASIFFNKIQIDNPLFMNGGYDFQVFMLRQIDTGTQQSVYLNDRESKDLSDSLDLDNLIQELKNDYFLMLNIDVEIWKDNHSIRHSISDIKINLQPIRVYLEDTYLSTLLDYATNFFPSYSEISCKHTNEAISDSELFTLSTEGIYVSRVIIPEHILWESSSIANPIRLKRLYIESVNMLLSVHTSALFYIAFDHSPLQFGCFERTNILTSSYRFGHALTMHYLSEAIFGAGWVVGSLEILGSPGGLARRVGAGLRDLVREPCRGLMRGPWPFLVGVTHGSASLLKHITQGTVESVSMVMGSVARNLDRLSLDEDHMRRTERERRMQPNGIGQALSRGIRGLGLSLLGAIGGIAHETIVVGCERGGTPTALAAGLTRGLIGAFTKPLSATADLVALAGHGLLNQAGWDPHPRVLWRLKRPVSVNQTSLIKLGPSLKEQNLLFICQMIDKDTDFLTHVIVTNSWLILLDETSEKIRDMIEIKKISAIKDNVETGEIIIFVMQTENTSNSHPNAESQEHLMMDPVCRARVAAYIGIVEDSGIKSHKILRFKTSPNLVLHYASVLKAAHFSSYENYWFRVL